jgi:hypothetical protein
LKTYSISSIKDCKKLNNKAKEKFVISLLNYNGSIVPHLFEGNEYLTFVIGSIDTKAVGDNAFANCTALTRFDASAEAVGEQSFAFCSSLKDFNFKDIKRLSKSSFEFSGLRKIEFPDFIQNIPEGCFNTCQHLTSISFNKVESIGKLAFASSGLSIIDLPYTLESIGPEAFEGSFCLTDIICERPIPPRITSTTFSGCSLQNIWFFSQSILDAYKADFRWSKYSGSMKIATIDTLSDRMVEIDKSIADRVKWW